jgi:L,D-peptidoglycan transpeptidase YkuD (ErfK/YbiS/YcfS/YnhG family)
MNIIIKKRFLLYKDYKLRCCIGKSGLSNAKKEGDLKTPKGKFKLGMIYYRKDKIKSLICKLQKKTIKKNMGWCDDPSSSKYNQEVKLPYKYKTEKLYRKNSIYDILINIKYNQSPVIKNKGSAIFLHLTNKKYKATKGCISILKRDLLKILPMINKRTKILIK